MPGGLFTIYEHEEPPQADELVLSEFYGVRFMVSNSSRATGESLY